MTQSLFLLLVGTLLGFAAGWGRDELLRRRQNARLLGLLKRELSLLVSTSERLLREFETYDPVGRYPKAHSFSWGDRPTLRLLQWIVAAYEKDRNRFMLPIDQNLAGELFDFVLFLENLRDNLERHLENLNKGELPSPRVGDGGFAELRDRANRLLTVL